MLGTQYITKEIRSIPSLTIPSKCCLYFIVLCFKFGQYLILSWVRGETKLHILFSHRI